MIILRKFKKSKDLLYWSRADEIIEEWCKEQLSKGIANNLTFHNLKAIELKKKRLKHV